jgi:hypothetical protein
VAASTLSQRGELGVASDSSCRRKAQCHGSHAQEASTLKVASARARFASCQLVSRLLNRASRRSELGVGSVPDPGGARTVPRIGQGSPRRGERVSPVSIASLLTELPDGIVRLCGRGEGTDNRTVVPLINDIDAPFFHRSASSSDKLARVQCAKIR